MEGVDYMTVYVVNTYSDVPAIFGRGGPIGVYSSEDKAKEAIEGIKAGFKACLGHGIENAYEFIIQEFEIDPV